GTDLKRLLANTEYIVHGTTVATNALLERKGAKAGLLATKGHRDILLMREGLKDERYNLRMAPPEPLVPRHRIIGVEERTRYDGSIATPLSRPSLEAVVRELKRLGVDAVAVSYLHSYRNPAHERATGRALAKALPGVYLSLSSEVLPQIKEFERTWTTLANAYVGPVLSRDLAALGRKLRDRGYRGEVFIMQSHGGVAPIPEAVRSAVGAVLSGPAGGAVGGRYCSRLLGEGDVITFDMGGTSTDIAVLRGGEPQLSSGRRIGPAIIAVPSLDIHSLGAGGGSIGRVGGDGILRVGPESAGAVPGPACYGKGGEEPTVTDANVVLGYLAPDSFLGGRISLDESASEKAVAKVARSLGTDLLSAAAGISRVVNTNMAEGIRLVSVRRGLDPRQFTLISFGGAAGLHISDVARQLGIRRVVVPAVAPVLSAWGMLSTSLRYEMVRSHVEGAHAMTSRRLRGLFGRLEAEGRKRLGGSGGRVTVRRSLDMRYGEQIFEIGVPLDGVDVDAPDLVKQAVGRFHKRHEELFAYSSPGQEVVIVNVRAAVVGELPAMPAASGRADQAGTRAAAQGSARTGRPAAAKSAARTGARRIYLGGGWTDVPLYRLEGLPTGFKARGPAVFESAMTTVLALKGDRATVTPQGWLDLRLT
ncbi:MAG: hydantoinase/oxoprolinase family protein, partial [Dehalococcoidia bacterium]|nr:hydantoinase/oxoprolinase family protein [Dehalococcoidia bacterium]